MASSDEFLPLLREWMEVFMHRSMRSSMRFTKEHGLTMAQVAAMFFIRHRGACGVSDVGDELGVTSAAASQMIDRLVQQGLISRSEDPEDRRVKQIVLTDRGLELLRESIHARQSWLDELAARMTPAEQEQAAAALRVLIEKTRQLETGGSEGLEVPE